MLTNIYSGVKNEIRITKFTSQNLYHSDILLRVNAHLRLPSPSPNETDLYQKETATFLFSVSFQISSNFALVSMK